MNNNLDDQYIYEMTAWEIYNNAGNTDTVEMQMISRLAYLLDQLTYTVTNAIELRSTDY